jgi:PPE-repeat protein
MDFGALPPEINSTRMYSGAGSAPLLAASSAWGALAQELHTAAEVYQSLIAELVDVSWWGPSAMAMLAAVGPYVSWMSANAAHAERASVCARVGVDAYEMAFAATVPPAEVAANRSLLSLLVATNVLGQNSSAIAVTEAHYAEMWAQDAMVMYGYAGAARLASDVTPFGTPPETTAANAPESQRAAVTQSAESSAQQQSSTDLIGVIRQLLEQLSASPLQSGGEDVTQYLPQVLKNTTSSIVVVQRLASTPANIIGLAKGLLPPAAAAAPVVVPPIAPVVPSAVGAGWSAGGPAAGFGRASLVGKLSVPSSWAGALPSTAPGAALSPAPAAAVEAGGEPPRGLLRGIPLTGAPRSSYRDGYVNRYGFRYNVLPHNPSGG